MRRADQDRLREERRAAGQCIYCGREPAGEGVEAGKKCARKQGKRDLRRRNARRAVGKCITCGIDDAEPGGVRCPAHATSHKAEENVTVAGRVADGGCRDCGEKLPDDQPAGCIRCALCRKVEATKQRLRREARLAEGKCGSCGLRDHALDKTRCDPCAAKRSQRKPESVAVHCAD